MGLTVVVRGKNCCQAWGLLSAAHGDGWVKIVVRVKIVGDCCQWGHCAGFSTGSKNRVGNLKKIVPTLREGTIGWGRQKLGGDIGWGRQKKGGDIGS